jgi:hypothetical protein
VTISLYHGGTVTANLSDFLYSTIQFDILNSAQHVYLPTKVETVHLLDKRRTVFVTNSTYLFSTLMNIVFILNGLNSVSIHSHGVKV